MRFMNMTFLRSSCLAAAFFVVVNPLPAMSQVHDNVAEASMGTNLVDTETNVATVTYYGQTFAPVTSEQQGYGSDYTWADLKPYVDGVFSDQATSEHKTPAELCEHLDTLVRMYQGRYQTSVDRLAEKLSEVWPEETDLQVAQLLQTKEGFEGLITALPSEQGHIAVTQAAHNQYLGLMMLADGAKQDLCPAPAASEGAYSPPTTHGGGLKP